MKKQHVLTLTFILFSILALLLTFYLPTFYSPNRVDLPLYDAHKVDERQAREPMLDEQQRQDGNVVAEVQPRYDDSLVLELIAKYGNRIDEIAVQASLFEVQEYLLSRYPADGQARFRRIISMAFPQLANAILAVVERMGLYNDWLIENYALLVDMNPLAREGALWQKRRAFFGADAEKIWADELALQAQKQQSMQEAMYQLEQAADISLDERLYQLQSAITENYGETVQQLVVSPGMVAQVFFGFGSVQDTLQRLSPEQRQAEINRLRKQLGYSDEQIGRLQERDEVRNQRWDNGHAYMAQRKQLVDGVDGVALDEALAVLREQFFKHEASTIAQEEASGFFRYQRPRVFGRN